jgi:hypothetical protein
LGHEIVGERGEFRRHPFQTARGRYLIFSTGDFRSHTRTVTRRISGNSHCLIVFVVDCVFRSHGSAPFLKQQNLDDNIIST